MIKLAQGSGVAALKRYDPTLRVRWSFEKKAWAVDAPYKKFDAQFLPAPVRYVQSGTIVEEKLLPELSERRILYRDKRYLVCATKVLDRRLLYAVVAHDTHRNKRGAVGTFEDLRKEEKEQESREAARRKDERVYGAWDYYRYLNRKHEDGGAGISTKGIKWDESRS